MGASTVTFTMLITLFFALSNGFAKIILNMIKNKTSNHKKIEILARSRLSSIESMFPEAMQGSDI